MNGPLPVLPWPPMAWLWSKVQPARVAALHTIVDSSPLRTADLDNVGPGGRGVIAADGLIVAEAAVGDICGGGFNSNGAAVGEVHEGTRVACTTVAVVAADGLVLVEGAAGDGNGVAKDE